MGNNLSIWKTAQGTYMIEWYEKHTGCFSPTEDYIDYYSHVSGVSKEEILKKFKEEAKKYGE